METALPSFLTNLGLVFTAIIGFFSDVLELYMTNPMLFLMFAVGFVAIVVSMGRSLVGR